MPPIRYLCRLGRSRSGSLDIRLATVSTDDLHFRVDSQPLLNALCLAVGKQIAAGTADQIRNDPAVIDAYLGAPESVG